MRSWRAIRLTAAAIVVALSLTVVPSSAQCEPFVPLQPTIAPHELRPGERGHMLTVLRGTEPTRIPVEIVSVIPQRGEAGDAILIRLLPGPSGAQSELARGMSGSPVYVRAGGRGGARLVGAVSSGWDFSDHALAIVTPIDAMCAMFSRGGSARASLSMATPLAVSGLSRDGAERLSRALGAPLAEGPAPSRGALPVERGRLAPGEAVSALLAWGDVEVSATGTVTATSKDGRFLAFGHPLLKRGDVAYPAARAIIHETVRSRSFPFKLASPTAIIGTVAQDREVGIGGRVGTFAPSISAALVFKDRDTGRREERAFRVVPDAFLSARLLEAVYGGLVEDAWGRRGQGTMSVTLRIEGKGVTNGWTRRDVSFSDDDVAAVALKQPCSIMDAFLTQPFEDVMPLGFRLDVEATEEPRALFIEDVEAPSKARPGEDVPVKVVLRPWRGKTVTREVVLKVPESASGVCELLVRGGGAQPMPQLAIEGGWRSIESLGSMLKEIAALDANDELIVELHADAVSDALKRAAPQKGRSSLASSDLLPEETELLSETKERRIKEGTLRILRADRYVDGMMKRIIQVDTDDIDTDAGPKKEPTKDAPKKGPKKASKASRPDAARP